MKVVVLGTGYRKSVTNGKSGNSLEYRDRNDSNYLLKIGDKNYVFDLGMDAFKHALKYTDMDSSKIDGAFFTHTHNDHTAGLYDLTHDAIANYVDGIRPEKGFEIYSSKMIRNLISLVHGPMYNCSPAEEFTEELFEKSTNFVDVAEEKNKEFLIGEISCDKIDKTSLEEINKSRENDSTFLVKPYRMDHGDERVVVYGFTFTSLNGYTVGFTADTRYCENVENLVSKSDYIFIDMARSGKNEYGKIYTHMNYEDIVGLAERYPKKIFIPIHTSDPTYNMTRELAKNFNNILAVEDDDVLEFSENGLSLNRQENEIDKENERI